MQVAYDVETEAVIAIWNTLGGSVNDPQGCGLSPEGGITTTDFQDLDTRVHEGTAGIRPGLFARGPIVTVIDYRSADFRALVGHGKRGGRDVIKGIPTCLSRQGAKVAGYVDLHGNPPTGSINIGSTGRAIQAILDLSGRTTNVQFN